jgi:hypothetical protein
MISYYKTAFQLIDRLSILHPTKRHSSTMKYTGLAKLFAHIKVLGISDPSVADRNNFLCYQRGGSSDTFEGFRAERGARGVINFLQNMQKITLRAVNHKNITYQYYVYEPSLSITACSRLGNDVTRLLIKSPPPLLIYVFPFFLYKSLQFLHGWRMPVRSISFQDTPDLLQWTQIWTRRPVMGDVIAHLLRSKFG